MYTFYTNDNFIAPNNIALFIQKKSSPKICASKIASITLFILYSFYSKIRVPTIFVPQETLRRP